MSDTRFSNLLTVLCHVPKNDAERVEHKQITQAVIDSARPYTDKYPIAPHKDLKNDFELVKFLLEQVVNVLCAAFNVVIVTDLPTARELARLRQEHQEMLDKGKSEELQAWLNYIEFCCKILRENSLFTQAALEMMCEQEIEDIAAMSCRMVVPFKHPLLDLIDS